MTNKEKLELIEKILGVEQNTLSEETDLNALREWDSLTILSLQIELTAIRPDLQFDSLFTCNTVGDICKMI
jgi:acyl carrier protein